MPREDAAVTTSSCGMLSNRLEPVPGVRASTAVYSPRTAAEGVWLKVHSDFAQGLSAIGLDSALIFLDLPGEVVSGHPDRHVVRVHLAGFSNAFYLKRQHIVRRREKWRNWRAGFGWVSRCEREAALLDDLSAAGVNCPRWVAVGRDGGGRAFLLVEEVGGAVELRRVLSDGQLSPGRRASLARDLGRTIASVHAAGVTAPELTAKHVLVSPRSGAIALIDWQSAHRRTLVPVSDRIRSLAVLQASVADHLATSRDRLRVARATYQASRAAGLSSDRFSEFVRHVLAESTRLAERRSLRDQRQAPTAAQRLVWVAGEAVCAIPEIAAIWPAPAMSAPFYGCEPGAGPVQLRNGLEAMLIRGRSVAPLGRAISRLRGRVWRTPGVTMGRVLFHLERYGIPAPRLLAFGQRVTGIASAEWFALFVPLPAPSEAGGVTSTRDAKTVFRFGSLLRRLHDAGCSVRGNPLTVFDHCGVRDVPSVRIARPATGRELGRLLAALPRPVRDAAATGYQVGMSPRSDS